MVQTGHANNSNRQPGNRIKTFRSMCESGEWKFFVYPLVSILILLYLCPQTPQLTRAMHTLYGGGGGIAA